MDNRCGGVVAPTNTFTEEDVVEGTEMLAKWLTTLTGDVVNWRAVITVGEMLPVAGSIFAATDAVGDIIGLARGNSEYRSDIFNWVSLGINLFAIVPIPAIGPARAVMRPALKAVRTSPKDGIAQALIVSIENALANICPGDLEETLNKVQSTLQNILKDFAAKIAMVLRPCR
ncbi:hypothetical protein [Pseudomonas sp. RL_105y_Pfl2_101]|uniref:hypothetical protein n=1 Tax=Pseudomonas sp. RL_105y_Pfl2_101 TaxID=3088708 RepID=UPI0030D87871